MLRAIAGSGVSLALAAVMPAAEPFQPLFNGRDLSGWADSPAHWSVRDGAITGQTTAATELRENTFLIWQGGEPANFELRVVFRLWADTKDGSANSGIQYRSQVVDPVNLAVVGYQADIDWGGQIRRHAVQGKASDVPRPTGREGDPHAWIAQGERRGHRRDHASGGDPRRVTGRASGIST